MRDELIILGICVISIVFGSWLYFGAPSVPTGGQQAAVHTSTIVVPFMQITSGNTAKGVSSRANYHVTSPQQFAELWELVYGSTSGIPAVDFSKNDVLGVFDGTHPTGGYALSVTSIDESGSSRIVVIRHIVPAATCAVTEAETSPFEFISVPKSARPLGHTDETITRTCD